MGNLSQEWRDHPASVLGGQANAATLQRNPETKQELPRTQCGRLPNRAVSGGGNLAELSVQAGSCRQGAVRSSLWPLGDMAQMWA